MRARDMLRALSGMPSERDDVLLRSPADQLELTAIAEALGELDQAPPALSSDLRSRLRGLVPGETTEDLATNRGRRTTRRSRTRTTTGRVRTGTTRRPRPKGEEEAETARPELVVHAGAQGAATSERRTKSGRVASGSRRRSGVIARAPRRSEAVPGWALGVLAAAAGFLVALALALQSGAGPGASSSSNHVARGPQPSPERPRGPLVSDLQARRGEDGQTQPSPAHPEPSASASPADRDPATPERPLDPQPSDKPSDRPGERQPGDARPQPSVEQPQQGPRDGTRVREPEETDPAVAKREPETPGPSQSPTGPAARETIVDDGARLEVALGRLNGSLAISDGTGTWRKLSRGEGAVSLKPGDRLRSARGGFMSLEDGAFEVCLDQGTELVVRGAAGGPVLGLERGRVHCEVQSLPADRHFVVSTAQGDYSVLGTVFAVEARPEASRVLVVEGTVKANNQRGETKVGAGLAAEIPAAAAPGTPGRYAARELGWAARLRPGRQLLFTTNFDDKKLGGFEGELRPDGRGGAALELGALSGNQYWGRLAAIQEGRIAGFRPAPDVYVQFSVWVDHPVQVLFQAFNASQKKEFKQTFGHPGGYWRTFTVSLLELSTYFDPGKNPVRVGDLFTDFEVYAGAPGDAGEILLDDVQIYRRVYR
ncbi:MAG: FecR domain-containing protein [Planctomycetota bacterium]